jgi:2-oxoglutarate ferredoxin oxidoreductase subunit alpha
LAAYPRPEMTMAAGPIIDYSVWKEVVRMNTKAQRPVMIDGSRVIIEAMARAGVDAYIGYPITPANWLYAYAQQRIPISLAAPDEISALQWATGISAAGKLPLTATSFPGLALMLEGLNMAYMMELPIMIVLAQRLGPSTGSATTGAQGDLLLLRGAISGGYPLPVFCPSDIASCWNLAAHAVDTALTLRTPVVLLTSKEMVMTNQSLDLNTLPEIKRSEWPLHTGGSDYKSYEPGPGQVPRFLPAGNPDHQIRLNASTHDSYGLIRKATPEAIANTRRLRAKMDAAGDRFNRYTLDENNGAETLIVTYGISAGAGRESVRMLRERGDRVSLLVLEGLIPVPKDVDGILSRYPNIVVVEENDSGLLAEMLFGQRKEPHVRRVNKIGNLIGPDEIITEVDRCH